MVVGVVAFPMTRLATGAMGSIDGLALALAAGAVAGAVIGGGQWLVLRGIGVDAWWILATAIGFAVGLAGGMAAVGYGTEMVHSSSLAS